MKHKSSARHLLAIHSILSTSTALRTAVAVAVAVAAACGSQLVAAERYHGRRERAQQPHAGSLSSSERDTACELPLWRSSLLSLVIKVLNLQRHADILRSKLVPRPCIADGAQCSKVILVYLNWCWVEDVMTAWSLWLVSVHEILLISCLLEKCFTNVCFWTLSLSWFFVCLFLLEKSNVCTNSVIQDH